MAERNDGAEGLSRRELFAAAGVVGAASVVTAATAGSAAATAASAGASDTRATAVARRRASVRGKRQAAIAANSGSPHPLTPLSADEITQAFSVIEADPRFISGSVFPIVTLNEPPKAEVLAWKRGLPFTRQAFAHVYYPPSNTFYEVVVDLNAGKIASWVNKAGSQPAVYADEYALQTNIIMPNPTWQAAMRKRGVNPPDVYLDGWAFGDIPEPGVDPSTTRLTRALCFYRGSLPNPYDRPIEGVVVTVDMNSAQVVNVADTGIRPVNTTTSGDPATTRAAPTPLIVSQPDGPSFQLDGLAVTWQKWQFRMGYSWREGLVLYQIGYEDKPGEVRSIIYRLSLDEIFVPYAIPDPNWVWRAAFDIGEYNLGQYTEPLQAGIDVPENAVFFDLVGPSDQGSAGGITDLPSSIALYERDAGVLWDRTDPSSFARDARGGRELVVTIAYVNGNYTYASEYVFRQDGSIGCYVIANGTTLNRGFIPPDQDSGYDTVVNKNIAAPIHQHFFNFRIDFDIDGTQNTAVESNLASVSSPYGNAFTQNETPLTQEQYRDLNAATYRRWTVQSTTRLNALGTPTGYGLEPADTTVPYAASNYPPLVRAPWAAHPFWLTRYEDGELYASGAYPNQGPADDGVQAYAAGDQPTTGKDVVVWYTAAFTHLPSVENYPVMSSERIGFQLQPDGFFDRDPALDVPPPS